MPVLRPTLRQGPGLGFQISMRMKGWPLYLVSSWHVHTRGCSVRLTMLEVCKFAVEAMNRSNWLALCGNLWPYVSGIRALQGTYFSLRRVDDEFHMRYLSSYIWLTRAFALAPVERANGTCSFRRWPLSRASAVLCLSTWLPRVLTRG